MPAVPSSAITIWFAVTDLDDSMGPGGDLQEYTYYIEDFIFSANVGFSIEFDLALYSDLEDPPGTPNADWDVIVLQPDPGLPDDGIFDALALTEGASLADPFTISFVWLGASGNSPGPQPFSINEFDSEGRFISTLMTGDTVLIPEPSTAQLVALSLSAIAAARRARRRMSPTLLSRGFE
jgi:hypothetical protein